MVRLLLDSPDSVPAAPVRHKISRKSRKHRQRGLPYAMGLMATIACVGMVASATYGGYEYAVEVDEGPMEDVGHRRLAGSGGGCNATHGDLPLLPGAIGKKDTTNVILSCIFILWSFVGLAIVCDEFFQPSLEAISEALSLSPDVAGATFLAAGSSAPELFTSLADAFGSASSIGMGTIVGSAMFNILVIVALSAAVAGKGGASLKIGKFQLN